MPAGDAKASDPVRAVGPLIKCRPGLLLFCLAQIYSLHWFSKKASRFHTGFTLSFYAHKYWMRGLGALKWNFNQNILFENKKGRKWLLTEKRDSCNFFCVYCLNFTLLHPSSAHVEINLIRNILVTTHECHLDRSFTFLNNYNALKYIALSDLISTRSRN